MGDRPPQGNAETTVEVANDQQQGETRDPFEQERYGRYGEGDRTAGALETGDRNAFRQQCEQMLTGFKTDLRSANDAMKIVNMDGERGIRPGTVPYTQHFDAAKQAYFKAIDKSTNMLFEVDAQGNRKIDPVTGRPKESQLNLAIQQERRLLNEEIVVLDQAVKANRPLNAEEMRKLGVNNPDARVALEQKITQDQMLKDLQRSSGYAQANFGLALMRSSVNLQGPDKARQQEAGQLLLEKASQDDPWMLGPPADENYIKHKRRVLGIIESTNAPAAASGDPRIGPQGQRPADAANNGGDGTARPGAPQVVQGQDGRRYIKEGTYTLPIGDVAPNSQNFRNPFDILRQVESTVTAAPLTAQQMQGFEDAIKVADSLDRAAIRAQIQQNEELMTRLKADRTLGPKIAHAEKQAQDNARALQTQSAQMNQMLGPLQQAGGSAVLNQLGQFQTVDQLNQWRNKPENRAAVQQFEGLGNGQGAAFLSVLSNFLNTRTIAAQAEAQMNTPELKPYNDARKSNQLLSALYQSSIDTRAHYVKALTADGHLNEQTKPRAVQLMQELATLDTSLPNDPVFKATAQKLGLPAEQTVPPGSQLPTDQTPRPGDATNPVGQQTGGTQLDQAMATLQQKFDAAPDKRAAMQQLQPEYVQVIGLADQAAASIIPQAIAANQALKPQLDAAVPPDKQARLQQIGTQLDAIPIKPEHQNLVAELQNPQTAQQRRTEVMTQIDTLYPERATLRKEMEQIMAPGLPIMQQMDQNTLALRAALGKQYQARMMAADAYTQAGDLVNGKKMLIEGLSKLLPQDRAIVLQNPKVIELGTKVGLTQAEIPQGPGGVPTGADTSATGQGAQPGQTGDAAAFQAANQSFGKAIEALEKQDMAGAKPHFEEAIKQADKSVNYEQSTARINELQQGLKTGTYQGQQLNFDQRLVLHGMIAQEIEKMEMPLKARATYARALRQNGQYADAERIIKESVATSDKLPVQLFRDHVALIGQDLQNPALNITANQEKKVLLQTFAQQLQGTKPDEGYINLPINTRKDMAAFYMGLRIDAQGRPQVGTTIFKPEEAMKAIDEAKAKYKEMGIDLDASPGKDPMLTSLAKLTLENSPKELKAQYVERSKFFDNAISDAAAGITGAAVVGITAAALLSRGKTLGPTAKGILALEGVAAAAFTRHAVHGFVSGESEDWGTSLVHGGASVGSLAVLYASRGALANRSLGKFSDDLFFARAAGEGAGGMNIGTLGRLGETATASGTRLSDDLNALIAARPNLLTSDITALRGLTVTDDLAKFADEVATASGSTAKPTLGDMAKALESGTATTMDAATQATIKTLGADARLAAVTLDDVALAGRISYNTAQSGNLFVKLSDVAPDETVIFEAMANQSGTVLKGGAKTVDQLTVGDLREFIKHNPKLAAENSRNLSQVLTHGDEVLLTDLSKQGLIFGKQGSVAMTSMENLVGIAPHTRWERGLAWTQNVGRGIRDHANPLRVIDDPLTATKSQVFAAQNWNSYGSSLATTATYANATNLWDLRSEKGFLDNLLYTNLGISSGGGWSGVMESVPFKALYLTPFNRAGAIGSSVFQNGGFRGRAWDLANGSGIARGTESLTRWGETATMGGRTVLGRTIPEFSIAPVTTPLIPGTVMHLGDIAGGAMQKGIVTDLIQPNAPGTAGYYKQLLERSQQPIQNKPLDGATAPIVPGNPTGDRPVTPQGQGTPQGDGAATRPSGAAPLLPGQLGVGDQQTASDQPPAGNGNPYVDGTQR